MKVTLEMDFNPTGIPYHRRPEDGHNYVNLREHPEEIDNLPEPAKEPTLKEMVQLLNSYDSPFETVGCESWTQEENGRFHKGCYISIVSADPSTGQDAKDMFVVYYHVAQALADVEDKNPGTVVLNFVLKPFLMRDKDRTGFQIAIEVKAIWNERDVAAKLWDAWLRKLVVNTINQANIILGRVQAESAS